MKKPPPQTAGSDTLAPMARPGLDHARRPASANTLKAYAGDWARFARWCRLRGLSALPPSAEIVGRYIADLISPQGNRPLTASSIERHLSGLTWGYAQRGDPLDRTDPHIADVLADIRCKHSRPPARKEAILPQDLIAMLATLPRDLRGLRDHAILLIGFAGGLRRSEIVGLDHGKGDTPDSRGWIDIFDDVAAITLYGKTGQRRIEITRGSGDQPCPVHALGQWLRFAKIDHGPIFVSISRDGRRQTARRLDDKHVARLIKRTAMAAGLRPDLPEQQRISLYSGDSLRSRRATGA